MPEIDFISTVHKRTKRDYLKRVNDHPKAESAKIAKQFGRDYWDGEPRYGYGGYRYDGRWRTVADAITSHYGVKPGEKILDVGCGKGYLLYEFTQAVPGVAVAGIDISSYAVANAKEEVRSFLRAGSATDLPYAGGEFDLVVSINTLHNLPIEQLQRALREIERVGKRHRYLCVESFRNEEEKANLLYWQLTCEAFFSVESWKWMFREFGYTGDYSFIFFE